MVSKLPSFYNFDYCDYSFILLITTIVSSLITSNVDLVLSYLLVVTFSLILYFLGRG